MASRCFNVGAGAKWAPLVVPPELNGQVLERFLDLLTGLDEDYLRDNPQTPPMYSSKLQYVRDPPGREQWLTVPWVLAREAGDCKSLCAWRAAEIRVRGGYAKAVWSAKKTNNGILFHVRVDKGPGPDGRPRIEDPSLILGMGWGENVGNHHTMTPLGVQIFGQGLGQRG